MKSSTAVVLGVAALAVMFVIPTLRRVGMTGKYLKVNDVMTMVLDLGLSSAAIKDSSGEVLANAKYDVDGSTLRVYSFDETEAGKRWDTQYGWMYNHDDSNVICFEIRKDGNELVSTEGAIFVKQVD